MSEHPVIFECAGEHLVGIVCAPEAPPRVGVLIIVGGPQYRIGSHRQFVTLSRRLAGEGVAVMRFDHRGIGDSGGRSLDFDATVPDIAAAISIFCESCPTLERIVLCGLCDAATASLLYWHRTRDERVHGMLLMNPWVRSERSLAATHIKHYYPGRVLQASFWRKLLSGGVDIRQAAVSLWRMISSATRDAPGAQADPAELLPARVAAALDSFAGPALVLLSSEDLTAREFEDFSRSRGDAAERIEQHVLRGADHTFTAGAARAEVESLAVGWLRRSYLGRNG